jgi:hypothetical protein
MRRGGSLIIVNGIEAQRHMFLPLLGVDPQSSGINDGVEMDINFGVFVMVCLDDLSISIAFPGLAVECVGDPDGLDPLVQISPALDDDPCPIFRGLLAHLDPLPNFVLLGTPRARSVVLGIKLVMDMFVIKAGGEGDMCSCCHGKDRTSSYLLSGVKALVDSLHDTMGVHHNKSLLNYQELFNTNKSLSNSLAHHDRKGLEMRGEMV